MEHLKGRKALVVDDDPDFRLVLIDVLARYGMQVVEAADGAVALGQLASEQPDLLILDQRLPRLSGLEVVERLRREGSQIPIIFITASHDADELAELAGLDWWLRKPFGLDQLVEAVSRVLEP